MKPILRRSTPPPGENSPAPLSPGVADRLCRQVQDHWPPQGNIQQAAQAAGLARSYLSQILHGLRAPRNREVYVNLFTQALGWTQEEVDQLIAQTQLQELGFTHPELSLRLAEVSFRSKELSSDQLEGLLDYLEGWLQRRRKHDAQ